MSVVCATLSNMWGSPPVYQLNALSSNPSDLSTCSYLVMTGGDYASIVSQISTSTSLSALQTEVSNLQNIVATLGAGSSSSSSSSSVTVPDYTLLAQFWGFAFVSVLTLWLVSHCGGMVLKAIRGGH